MKETINQNEYQQWQTSSNVILTEKDIKQMYQEYKQKKITSQSI